MVYQIIYILLSFVVFPSVYAQTVITEMQPQGDEFVEIKDFDSFHKGNLSKVKILDANGNTSYNTLSLLKKTNSSLSLLVGSNFQDSYAIEHLNCSIYKTSGTQVSKGGLLSGGEEIHLVNEKTNQLLSWVPQKDFTLSQNQSIDTLFDVVTSSSPCAYNPLPTSKLDLEDISSRLCSCPEFSLKSNAKITNDTIAYNFITNTTTNASVEYWIEFYNGSLAKEKIVTTHFSTKYFTPSQMGIYTIFAKLTSGDCIVERQIDVMYYQPPLSLVTAQNSSIAIENKQELLSLNTDELHYKISRGDTAKRAVKFYFQNEEFATVYVQKYSQISGRLKLPDSSQGLLEVKGLGINVSLTLSKKKVQMTSQSGSGGSSSSSSEVSSLSSQSSKGIQKMDIDIFNISQTNSSLLFSLQSTHNGTIECSVVDYRTKLSSIIKKEIPLGITSHRLALDKQKIIGQGENTSLELFCKFKKSHLKTFSSKRIPLNISFAFEKRTVKNDSSTSLETSSRMYGESSSIQRNVSSTQLTSKQSSLKSYVIYIIATILCVIVGLFLVFRNK